MPNDVREPPPHLRGEDNDAPHACDKPHLLLRLEATITLLKERLHTEQASIRVSIPWLTHASPLKKFLPGNFCIPAGY